MYKYKLNSKIREAVPGGTSSRQKYQEERIAAFKQIQDKLNTLYPLIDNAKEETIAYYKENPQSYAVVYGTDMILDYLNDIEELLKA